MPRSLLLLLSILALVIQLLAVSAFYKSTSSTIIPSSLRIPPPESASATTKAPALKQMTTDTATTLPLEYPPPKDYSHLLIDGWFHERNELWPGQAFSLQVTKVLYHRRSNFQDILVFESERYGTVLVLDGVIQATERDEHSYSEMMAHIPLYSHPNPKKVLVIGGGDGGVLREVARHPSVTDIVICELDGDVISVSKQYLPFMAVGFDDPRVQVHIMDGAKFMSENKATFDVIITDSSDPVGPASVLFETPFYNAMYDSLRPGGVVCTQGECLWLHLHLIRTLIQAITPLFQTVEYAYVTIPSYPSGQIGFVLATKPNVWDNGNVMVKKEEENAADKPLETEVVGCKSPRRVPVEGVKLKYYTPAVHRAAFVLPAFAEQAIFGDDE